MSVRSVRQLRGRVQAEVGLGHQKNGNWVGVTVELDLHSNPAVRDALDALHRAIEERALGSIAEAMSDRAKRPTPERKP